MQTFGTIPADKLVEVEQNWVGTAAPAGTPDAGDIWWDTDETAPGMTTPLTVVNGGTGATSPATARTSLAVPAIGNSTTVAGAPTTGTWARGDQYLDSANVVWTCVTAGTPGMWTAPPGTELAYNQITASVNPTTTNSLVIEGTSRTYDGSPIVVEFYAGAYQGPIATNGFMLISLWDGSTDLGYLGFVQGPTGGIITTMLARRKFTPTVGTHNYRVFAGVNPSGNGVIYAGPSGVTTWGPAYIRVMRA